MIPEIHKLKVKTLKNCNNIIKGKLKHSGYSIDFDDVEDCGFFIYNHYKKPSKIKSTTYNDDHSVFEVKLKDMNEDTRFQAYAMYYGKLILGKIKRVKPECAIDKK
jgi:hypothetical protein